MASYEERILEAIRDSKGGLTTVDVAKRASVSKTTVIKYLSVLSSEGLVEFAEVGPSKLWKLKSEESSIEPIISGCESKLDLKTMPIVDIDLRNGNNKTIYFSFRIEPEQICALMKKANRCIRNYAVDQQ